MTFHSIQTDAIYERGVLRPLLPLDLQEHEVVSISISPTSPAVTSDQWRQQILDTAGKWQGELERPIWR